MPYKVEKKGEEWCVINIETEENKACHETEELAERQVRLLESLEKEATDG